MRCASTSTSIVATVSVSPALAAQRKLESHVLQIGAGVCEHVLQQALQVGTRIGR